MLIWLPRFHYSWIFLLVYNSIWLKKRIQLKGKLLFSSIHKLNLRSLKMLFFQSNQEEMNLYWKIITSIGQNNFKAQIKCNSKWEPTMQAIFGKEGKKCMQLSKILTNNTTSLKLMMKSNISQDQMLESWRPSKKIRRNVNLATLPNYWQSTQKTPIKRRKNLHSGKKL